jgi:hypothetical protein
LRWLLRENSGVAIVSTPGRFPTEQEDREFVLPAKAATFSGQKRIEELPQGPAEGAAGAAVDNSVINCEKENVHEGRIRSSS